MLFEDGSASDLIYYFWVSERQTEIKTLRGTSFVESHFPYSALPGVDTESSFSCNAEIFLDASPTLKVST